jgi:predicted phosphodiesterase
VLSRASLAPLGRALSVVLVALVAAGGAMSAWGGVARDVGPLQTTVALVPSISGGVAVGVPPLGRLELATHAGPLRVRATVTGIRPDRARELLTSDRVGRTVTRQVTADSQDALAVAAAKGVVVALLAAGITCGVVFRRRRAVLLGTAAVTLVLAASGGIAAATVRSEALGEPKFDGLLVQAPALIGRVRDFDAYSARLAELTSNVAGVYGRLATLPASPGADSTRFLWVSDIHNNPAAFTVMRRLADQFEVSGVIDTGDIVDLGSTPENRLLSRIGDFDVPYLYVRGNHDSRLTQAAIAAQENAVVLDDGATSEIAGVRFAGIGDPLFRPNKEVKDESDQNDTALLRAGKALRAAIEAEGADVALVHEPKMAEPLFGAVPLVLDGHVHERRSRVGEGTLELTQGSSGGAGLRTLDEGTPLPLQMSILHFDGSGALLAVDDITIGGLGQRSVTVERRTPASYDVEPAPAG